MADGLVTTPATPPAFVPATPPSLVDLRPLSTSELIDRGFNLYRAHFAGFLLLALLSQSAPLVVALLRLDPPQGELLQNPIKYGEQFALFTAVLAIAQMIAFCFKVVMTFYIADAYLGKIPSMKSSFRRFTRCVFASIWTCLLNFIIIFLTALPAAFIFGATTIYLNTHILGTIGLVIAVVLVAGIFFVMSLAPVLIVFMRLMVTIPAVALEGLSGWKAVQRSAALVRYDPGLGILYWGEMRLSFLLLPLFVIGLLILPITSLPLLVHQMGEIIHHGSTDQIAAPPDFIMALSQVLTSLAGSLILPLYCIATTFFYYDVRIRREGFDLEFMANRLRGRA